MKKCLSAVANMFQKVKLLFWRKTFSISSLHHFSQFYCSSESSRTVFVDKSDQTMNVVTKAVTLIEKEVVDWGDHV